MLNKRTPNSQRARRRIHANALAAPRAQFTVDQFDKPETNGARGRAFGPQPEPERVRRPHGGRVHSGVYYGRGAPRGLHGVISYKPGETRA